MAQVRHASTGQKATRTLMRWVFWVVVLLWSAIAVAEDASSPPALEELAGLPVFSSPELSPDGEWLAWFGQANNSRALVVKKVKDDKNEPWLVTGSNWTLRRFDWLTDNRMLLYISIPQSLQGVPITVTRLVVVDPKTQKVRLMFKKDTGRGNYQIQDHVISTLPNNPDEILVQANPTPGQNDGVRYAKLSNGRLTKRFAQRPAKSILFWQADRNGEVRVGFGVTNDQKSAVLRLKDSKGKWRDLPDLANEGSFEVVGLPVDRPGVVFALSSHEYPLGALYEFDVDSEKFGKVIAQNDESVISGVALNQVATEVETIYYASEVVATEYRDPMVAALTSSLDKQLKDTTNVVVSASDDRKWALVRSSASDVDPHYYLFDGDRGRVDFLGSEYRALQQRKLATTVIRNYAARDGLTIPAYVTLPAGLSADEVAAGSQRLPFVVLPHGGPHARDFLRFDWLVQLLASRGFGVLQMNFRGSTGYGREFMLAGEKNWGKAMQDDVTDGTRWLVEEKLADPERLCIAGGSYGGYAALMGVVKEPDLYQAAISFNGVADLPDLLRLSNRYRAGRYNTRFIGNLWRDRKSLAHNSPARRVADIKVPVLLVHGDKDRVVDVRQSRKMHKAMLARKNPKSSVEYVELKDGNHYLSRGNNRVEFARRAVKFLEANCAG